MGNTMLLHRIPPHNIEAERGILASFLLDPGYTLPHVVNFRIDNLYRANHRKLLTSMLSLAKDGKTIDLQSVSYLHPNKTEIAEYLTKIAEEFPSPYGIKNHLEEVNKQAFLREIITQADKTTTDAFDGTLTKEEYLKSNKKFINQVIVNDGLSCEFDMGETVSKVLKKVEAGNPAGIPSGFIKLDRYIGGLIPANLIIVGGRPGMGKTAFACSIISSLLFSKRRVLFFSLEMSKELIITRFLSFRAKIALEKLKNGSKLNSEEWARLAKSSAVLSGQDFIIDDRAGLSNLDIQQATYLHHIKKPVDIIFIDYLQKMKHPTLKYSNKSYEISETIKTLDLIKKELKIPVVLICQLSREVENRPNKRPRQSDLRDCGDLEQSGDIILFPFRPSEYGFKGKNNEELSDEIIIEKNKDGRTGSVKVEFVDWLAHYREKQY